MQLIYKKNRIILLITATSASGLLNCLLVNDPDSMLLFISPSLLWGLALVLPIIDDIEDKMLSFLIFIPCLCALWLVMLLIAWPFTVSPYIGLPFWGGISALCSYGLYSKLLLDHYSPRDALICFSAGSLALILSALTTKEPIGQLSVLFLYWQSLVGIGHAIGYSRKHNN